MTGERPTDDLAEGLISVEQVDIQTLKPGDHLRICAGGSASDYIIVWVDPNTGDNIAHCIDSDFTPAIGNEVRFNHPALKINQQASITIGPKKHNPQQLTTALVTSIEVGTQTPAKKDKDQPSKSGIRKKLNDFMAQ